MTVRYAILLKIHYWDEFVERRFQHLLRKAGSGDVYLFVDETHGSVGQLPHPNVIRATELEVEKLGLLPYPPGKVFWYNADYPLYYLFLKNNSYDYYLMCEYDTVFNIEIDDFVSAAANDRIDYVGFPLANKHWGETCDGVYPDSFVLYHWLNAISLHSNRSVEFLFQRRKSLTDLYKAGQIVNWPYSELFIPSEMHNNGFLVSPLGDYGKVEKYDFWPPNHEKDLPLLEDQDFLHPVLNEPKYVASCLRYGSLHSYFFRDGQMRRLLGRSSTSPLSTLPTFLTEVVRRIRFRVFANH
jgi:hypothetical protein